MHRANTIKALWALRIIVIITTFLAAAPRLSAQDNFSKIGGFGFRIDDQHPSTAWSQYREVFKNRGSNFSFAANLMLAPMDSSMLRTLVADGNELMDHTPDHSTLYFTDPNENKYRGLKGIDHCVDGMDRICLSIDRIDTVNSLGEMWINIKEGLGYPVKSTGFPKSLLNFPVLGIYSPECKLFFRITSYEEVAGAVASVTLWSAWNEPVSVADMDGVRFLLIHAYDVHVSDDGLALMAQRSLDLSRQFGLPSPTTWIQPGAPNAYLPSDQIKRVLGNKLHYAQAATFVEPALKCFEEVDGGSSRFALSNDVNLDSVDLDACKRLIADRSARNFVTIGLSHFLSTSKNARTGDWQAYLTKTDSILAWCKRKSIPVRTNRDWAKVLYETPQNPSVNIFPMLQTDLDEDGKPDGFSLAAGEAGASVDRADGVQESGGVSYSSKSTGTICRVASLAGFEKGVNAFSLYTKGAGGSVEVEFTFHSSVNVVKKYTFPATTSQWKKYDTTVVIPSDVSICDVKIQALKVGNSATKISGLSLAKTAVQITITASTGSNGAINPSGVVPVIFGEDKSFTFTPNSGYTVSNVVVDSLSIGSVSAYTFPTVTANHKISVTYRLIKKPVAVTAAATELTPTSVKFNGSVNPNGLSTTYRFEFGLTASYGFATPNATATTGSSLVSVSNPMSSLASGTTYHYRISASNADGTVFGRDTLFTTPQTTLKITATAGPNGSITPSGTIALPFGGRQSFVITPDKGYRVAALLRENAVVGTGTSYEISSLTKDETLSVSFAALPISTTSVEQLDGDLPLEFALAQNYPNPFNPSTTIRFSVPKNAFVSLKVFNMLGIEVASLISQDLPPGNFSTRWNADVPSGTYFCLLRAGEFAEVKKMILLR
jgi:hypothetical protein